MNLSQTPISPKANNYAHVHRRVGWSVNWPDFGMVTHMRRDEETWARIVKLRAEGLSDPEVARCTGIPRSTTYMHFVRQREGSAAYQTE